jgi:hypothetical protein
VWRDYNERAACENVIKELDQGHGLPTLICPRFGATEAALAVTGITWWRCSSPSWVAASGGAGPPAQLAVGDGGHHQPPAGKNDGPAGRAARAWWQRV